MSKSSLHLASQFSIHLIKWNHAGQRTAGIENPNLASAKTGATFGVVDCLPLI